MAFNFDVNNPTDSFLIPSYPDNERSFRTDVKAMLEIEHDTVEGRHKFGTGDDAARNAITTWKVGSLWFNTSSSPAVIQRVASLPVPAGWENVDARSDAPHINEQSDYSVCQFASYDVITPGAGTPMTCEIDLLKSPYKRILITADTIISDPINVLGTGTGKGVSIALDIIQSGGGQHDITYGSGYLSQNGTPPVVAKDLGITTLMYLRKVHPATFYVVTTIPNIKLIT